MKISELPERQFLVADDNTGDKSWVILNCPEKIINTPEDILNDPVQVTRKISLKELVDMLIDTQHIVTYDFSEGVKKLNSLRHPKTEMEEEAEDATEDENPNTDPNAEEDDEEEDEEEDEEYLLDYVGQYINDDDRAVIDNAITHIVYQNGTFKYFQYNDQLDEVVEQTPTNIVTTLKLLQDMDLNYNDDGQDADNGTAATGTSFGAANTKFVSSVTQNEGQIQVIHRDFAPDITWNDAVAGTNDGKPTISITIAGNSDTSLAPNIATTSVYGITKLSSALDSNSETIAATSNAVKLLKDNIDSLDYAVASPQSTNQYIKEISQVNGQINAVRADLGVTIGSTANSSNTNVSINVGTETKNTNLPNASTSQYGVTKLSSAINSNSEVLAATPKAVKDAIESLDVNNITAGLAADKTITALSQTDGKIAASAVPIAIANTQVSGLGTASVKDVPISGDASTTQVVMGNDSRLTDARNAADVQSWAKAVTKPAYTASEVGAIPLPELPEEDGTYSLKLVITDGQPEYHWVQDNI